MESAEPRLCLPASPAPSMPGRQALPWRHRVENWSVAARREFAAQTGDAFPPTQYWKEAATPAGRSATKYRELYPHPYGRPAGGQRYDLYRPGPVIAEQCGLDFTTADVGRIWLKYLPVACTAEADGHAGLHRGVPAGEAALSNNPYVQWIGADIRSDPFAYMAPVPNPSPRRWLIRTPICPTGATASMVKCSLPRPIRRLRGERCPRGAAHRPDGNSGGLSVGSRPTLGAGGSPQPTGLPGRRGRRWISVSALRIPSLPNNNACLTVFGLALGEGRHGNPVR